MVDHSEGVGGRDEPVPPRNGGSESERLAVSLSALLDEWHAVHRSIGTSIGAMAPNPASDEQIRAAEAAAGLEFPADVWEWFRWSNGFMFGTDIAWKSFLPNGWTSSDLTLPTRMASALEPGALAGTYWTSLNVPYRDQGAAEATTPLPVNVVWLMEHDILLGVECSGPQTGAVYWMGEGAGGWTARSLGDLIRRALRFNDLGLIHLDEDAKQLALDEDAVRQQWPKTGGLVAPWFNDPGEGIPAWPDALIWRWPS